MELIHQQQPIILPAFKDTQFQVRQVLANKNTTSNKPNKKHNNDSDSNVLHLRNVSQIVTALIHAYQKNQKINVMQLIQQTTKVNHVSKAPKLVDVISALPDNYRAKLTPLLKAKPVRTASGIAVVAVMCKPHRCPHIATTGNICIYCPGGPDSDFQYSTQSYTGYQPTSMRAIRARYDPFIQARDRIDQLRKIGHDVDKVQYIIMGGTFMSLPDTYRDYFIRSLHDALSGHVSSDHREAVRFSQQSKAKCIGITIETRPDFCQQRHLSDMLGYGCTRLQIGVQSIYQDIARDTNRGHTVQSVKKTFALAKDCAYKIVTHIMPDLPNMGVQRDLQSFKQLFQNPDFRPDGVKLYPTLVIRGTGLYQLWKSGKYRNYHPDALVDIVAKLLALVPPWTRIYRVQRDIPMPLVSSGVQKGNLRQLALARMKEMNVPCRDVRTREVGIREVHQKVRPQNIELIRRDYAANQGWQTFLSYEDPQQDILVGLLRLRKCSHSTFRPELITNTNQSPQASQLSSQTSLIRELHVYGSVVPIHTRDPLKFQHQGFGTMLMEEAERIARDQHMSVKMAVIAGVGTRHYYRKLGYQLEGPYMVKMLK